MEEKQSQIWSPQARDLGKYWYIIQSKSQGLRTEGAKDTNPSPSAGEGKVRCSRSISEVGGRGGISPFSDFCSLPNRFGENNLPIQAIISYGSIFSQTHPDTVFNLGTHGSFKLIYKVNYHKG